MSKAGKFDIKGLHKIFIELCLPSPIHDGVQYQYQGEIHRVDQITFLDNSELRIFIDNFPGQKRYYESNIPIRTIKEFQSVIERTGLKLTRIDPL